VKKGEWYNSKGCATCQEPHIVYFPQSTKYSCPSCKHGSERKGREGFAIWHSLTFITTMSSHARIWGN
jgi:ribosomal protein L37AE/L43A